MESAKAETCPKCDSREMNNLVYVRTGEAVRVYVKCARCGEFVARYWLARYTSEETYESLLRTLREYAYASGKRLLQEIDEYGVTVKAEFERVQKLVEGQKETRRVVELIRDARANGEENADSVDVVD